MKYILNIEMMKDNKTMACDHTMGVKVNETTEVEI